MTVDETFDRCQGNPVGCGIDRAHQQSRHIQRSGREMALHAIGSSCEFGRANPALVERVKYWAAARIDRRQLDHWPARHPAEADIIRKINGAWSLRIDPFAL